MTRPTILYRLKQFVLFYLCLFPRACSYDTFFSILHSISFLVPFFSAKKAATFTFMSRERLVGCLHVVQVIKSTTFLLLTCILYVQSSKPYCIYFSAFHANNWRNLQSILKLLSFFVFCTNLYSKTVFYDITTKRRHNVVCLVRFIDQTF